MLRRLTYMVGPLLIWAGIIWLRASWSYDIHPWQPLWIAWVMSMSAGAFLAGVAFHIYWSKPRSDDADSVQQAADDSVGD